MKNSVKKIGFSFAAVVFWIAVWHILAVTANRDLMLKIPLPLDTLRAFLENCAEAGFWAAVGRSLLGILLGFGAAVLFGGIFGIISGSSAFFKTLTAPVMHLIRSVPVAAFVVLAWLWIPSPVLPSFISFFMVFPIVWSHIEAGLLSVDARLIEMARVMGMNRMGIIRHIKIPATLPQFRTAVITGLSFAWKSGVAAEVITDPVGRLGALLSSAKSSIDYEQVFAVTLTVVLLSALLQNALRLVWRERSR